MDAKSSNYEEVELATPSDAPKTVLVKADVRNTVETITLTWNDWVHSPIYYTRCRIILYRSGDWVFSCNADDRSAHSDWDITLTLRIVTSIGGAEVAVLGDTPTADVDHGDNADIGGSGYHSEIWRGWQHFQDQTWSVNVNSHINRDN
ncbi:MAG: hypothetical protein WCJ40_20655 [Planctomycetota bacterium]